MYTPSHFEESRLPVLHELMRDYPFAAVVAITADGLQATHVPLILEATRGALGTLKGHIARANSTWQQTAAGAETLAIFQGANHYVSPTWYPSKVEHGRVVPTWNYVAVHARGHIAWIHDKDWLRGLVEALTNHHERHHAAPWHVSDAPAEYLQRMLGAIVGFEISITHITGSWKLSQNRSEPDRAGVIAALSAHTDDASRDMASLIDSTRRR